MRQPAGEQVERLLARRFAELPRYCGEEATPGTDEVEEWRDWSELETTPDQQRIERFIDRYDLERASILHVGVGNSQLAARFGPRARLIVGTTISTEEKARADGLGIPNYYVHVSNKYSGVPVSSPDSFDFVIDNNPSAFACCLDHFVRMLAMYRAALKETGMIVTDRVGLGWVVSTPGANPRWKFDFDDWAALGGAFGLRPERVDVDVYVLAGARAVVKRGSIRRRLLAMLGVGGLRRSRP